MKNNKTNLITAALVSAALGLTASVMAGPSHGFKGKDIERSVIKVKAEQGEGIFVVVGGDGERKKYDFSFDELENMENIEAELGDLDEETKTKVVKLLSNLSEHDAKIIEFKDADIVIDGAETEIFMIKKGNGEDEMHVEIDVEGEGANQEKRLFIHNLLGENKGHRKNVHKRMKWMSKNGEKRDAAKIIKKIIEKSELTAEQIEDIRAALDAK